MNAPDKSDEAGVSSAPSPAQVAKQAASSPLHFPPEALKEAEKWGHVEGGSVYVDDGGEEREVGPAASEDPLAFYAAKYLRLMDKIKSFSSSLDGEDLRNRNIFSRLKDLSSSVKDPKAVGDMQALRSAFEEAKAKADSVIESNRQKHSEAIAKSVEEHQKIAEAAEALAASINSSTNWKQMGQKFQDLFEEWKAAQSADARGSNKEVEALWTRFAAARSEFNRRRREWVKAKIAKKSEAKAAKEKIVEKAEALSSTTDWASGSKAFAKLMDEWKKAGRADREDDDALWEKFKAASDRFYNSRNREGEEMGEDEKKNLEAKRALLEEAEKLVPIKSTDDIKEVKRKLEAIEKEWDTIGRVPRDEVRRCEERLKKVEDQVEASERMEWKRTDPRPAERKQLLISQLQSKIDMLDKDIEHAQGDEKEKLEEEKKEKEVWLKTLQNMKD
ncbi:MAG: DUF349 domain-containing protein [Aeriscardovia sp.]|nr:DUF349 domain-containing protein [Aeriscardovia sp.]